VVVVGACVVVVVVAGASVTFTVNEADPPPASKMLTL
jgi:hypothetical protein